jgi:hypothetical protein
MDGLKVGDRCCGIEEGFTGTERCGGLIWIDFVEAEFLAGFGEFALVGGQPGFGVVVSGEQNEDE